MQSETVEKWGNSDVLSKFGKSAFGKSSLQVSLLIIGTTGLSACQNKNTNRYEYASRDDCVKDWGETECQKQSSASGGSGGHGGGSYYYYRSAYDKPANGVSHAKSVVRGGFGGMARGGS